VDDTSSDSDGTISSDSELENFAIKKKAIEYVIFFKCSWIWWFAISN